MKYKPLVVIVFFAMLIFFYLKGVDQDNKLEKDHLVSVGRIYELGESYKSGNRLFFQFKFVVNSKTFFGNTGIPCDRKNKSLFRDILVNREMPVVYENGNPDNCEMLLVKADYDKYNLKIPKEYITIVDSVDAICSQSN